MFLSRRVRVVTAVIALAALTAAGRAQERPLIRVQVTDAATGQSLPCRLTLLNSVGELAPLVAPKEPHLAYRPGVLYTGSGEATFEAAAGKYQLYATRGLEYSLGKRSLEIKPGTTTVRLKLEREVDTSGYVSCDPHIHTLTHSGHGDATLQERMSTIAGEGIELAIATDHNHHVDYAPVARATGTAPHFTPVIGNEVTTKVGHFNAFPIRPGAPVPDYQSTDWATLIAGMRATPGVRVVMLNHPNNNHSNFIPTDPKRFHPGSGESLDGRPWSFDGYEVVTSAALQSDIMRPYRDWFALLNRGLGMAGLGSSDTHDVNQFILGQGRTYIASTAQAADQIDVQEACDSILAGKVLASMGLLTEMWVDGTGVGGTSTAGGSQMEVRIKVQGPRWINADRVELFSNGQKILDRPILPARNAVIKADLTLRLPRPKHDTWLVAVATGPGVDQPYWPIPRPYQPLRADWEPRVIGSTNFIRVDGDGDRTYTSPLVYARKAVEQFGTDPARLMAALRPYDEATAVQAASVCRERGLNLQSQAFRRAIDNSAGHVRHGFVAYQNLLQN